MLSGRYRKLKPMTVHSVHNSYQNFQLRHKLMFIPSFAFFQRIVFCSHASHESFPSLLRWLGGDRIHVVQNGVDLDRIDRIANGNQTTNGHPFTFTTVGLVKIKNPLTVLQAFRQGPAEAKKLVFIGEGNLRPLVAQEVEKSGSQKQVEITGMVERDSVFEHFYQSDVFISASWGEGLPVAVLEAMACHRPVILSDIPPHREIAEGVDFIPLLKPDDVAGFAREMNKFREMSPTERVSIGSKCRQIVEERFSLPVMHAGFEEVYAQLTNGRISALAQT